MSLWRDGLWRNGLWRRGLWRTTFSDPVLVARFVTSIVKRVSLTALSAITRNPAYASIAVTREVLSTVITRRITGTTTLPRRVVLLSLIDLGEL